MQTEQTPTRLHNPAQPVQYSRNNSGNICRIGSNCAQYLDAAINNLKVTISVSNAFLPFSGCAQKIHKQFNYNENINTTQRIDFNKSSLDALYVVWLPSLKQFRWMYVYMVRL